MDFPYSPNLSDFALNVFLLLKMEKGLTDKNFTLIMRGHYYATFWRELKNIKSVEQN